LIIRKVKAQVKPEANTPHKVSTIATFKGQLAIVE